MGKAIKNHFQFVSRDWVDSLLSIRKGEKKIGEEIQLCPKMEDIANYKADYVVFGIMEDVGPRANLGRGGSDSGWLPAMKKFLNMQDNQYLGGKEILLAGYFDFTGILPENASLEELRHQTSKIDDEVAPFVKSIVEAGKIPIVIGGGHNNSYPIIKGTANGLKTAVDGFNGKINSINLDPHADFREMEGRHSGNGFRYAFEEGFLGEYSMVALHESYNSKEMIEKLRENRFYFSTYEDIFLRKKWGFKQAILTALQKINNTYFGIELDLDSVENIPSSAETPCGISTRNARYFISLAAQTNKCCYLHIAEAAPSLKAGSDDSVGKLIAYLISDFIKTHRENRTILHGKNT